MLRRALVFAVLTTIGLWAAAAFHSMQLPPARADGKSNPASPPQIVGATSPAVARADSASPPAASPRMPATGPGSPVRMAAAPVDSFVAERDSLMNDVLQRIAGRENAPAESVFKNIKVLKGVPAGRLPRIMNLGWGRSLGVSCRHCHVPGHWADDDKPQKQITRDMTAMLNTINTELLPKIKNLKSEKPFVNCTTCHRGAVKPATNL
jgi:hypothetical protein